MIILIYSLFGQKNLKYVKENNKLNVFVKHSIIDNYYMVHFDLICVLKKNLII